MVSKEKDLGDKDFLTIDFEPLKDFAKDFFIKKLEEFKEDKLLMIDKDLFPFFRIMIGKTEKGLIKDTIILDPDCGIDVDSPVVIFVMKANIQHIRTMIRLINENSEKDKKFIVFFCPRYTVLCKETLDQGSVLKSLTVYELPYELIPIEKDVLTLDDNNGFKNLVLGYNYQTLTLVKHSIQRLEALYGKIPLKYSKGAWSCQILNSISGKEKEAKEEGADESQYSEIDAMVLIDRTVDYYTPLITQMTFEGIIDEFFGIVCGTIEIDNKIIDPETKGPTGKKTLYLTGNEDILFSESRDLHFNMMKEHFPRKFQEMKTLCEKKDSAKTLTEMADYIKKLRNLKIPQLQSLFQNNFNLLLHLDASVVKPSFKHLLTIEPKIMTSDGALKEVLELLELEIAKCEEKQRLMRLFCLLSLTNNGIPKDNYATLTKEFVDAFGMEELVRIMNLERSGILKRKDRDSQWSVIKDAFGLINEDVKIDPPNDIAYTYNGYAPLSVRLVEKLMKTGWGSPELDKLPGPKIVPSDEKAKLRKLLENDKQSDRKKVILVYYVGGVTFAEISCFRYLSALTGNQFIVATTQFINGNRMVDAFKDDQGSLLKPESLAEIY